MRRVLASPEGRALYRQRQITIEPVFGQIKFNRALKRLQRRGRTRRPQRVATNRHDPQHPKLHHRLAVTTP